MSEHVDRAVLDELAERVQVYHRTEYYAVCSSCDYEEEDSDWEDVGEAARTLYLRHWRVLGDSLLCPDCAEEAEQMRPAVQEFVRILDTDATDTHERENTTDE
jgi:rubredoxin